MLARVFVELSFATYDEPIQRPSDLWSGSSGTGESVVLSGDWLFDCDLNQTMRN